MLSGLFEADLETWKQFISENWYILVIALLALLLIIKIVKTVLKWALVAAIIIGVLLYSGHTLDDLNVDKLKSIGEQAAANLKREALEVLAGESTDAVYTADEDGSFTVRTDSLVIKGRIGEDEVTVTYHGAPLGRWKVDDTISSLINQAKAAS